MPPSETTAQKRTVRWQRLDGPGVEECTLEEQPSGWTLQGWVTTVLADATVRAEYAVAVDRDWRSRHAEVRYPTDGDASRLILGTREDGSWWDARGRRPDLAGCTDIDVSITPSTNTLPIRRCRLRIGESADIVAAWIRPPEKRIDPLAQRYTRLGMRRYRYESLGSGFVGEFEVDEEGLVVDYPGFRARLRNDPEAPSSVAASEGSSA